MFTNLTASYNNGDVLIEAACLSTDTKPTDGIANGSACIEMDTGDKYMFDEAGGQWIKLGSGGGGDTGEVWLVGNQYLDTGNVRRFRLLNNGSVDHATELYTNAINYQTFINDVSLPYFIDQRPDELSLIIWADNENEESWTKYISIEESDGSYTMNAYYMDATTAPTSVEVSVKAK